MFEFLRFGIVGFFTAAGYATGVWLTVEVLKLPSALGVGIAYVLAVTFNYIAHRKWTFRTVRTHRSTGPRYLLIIVTLLLINVLATLWLPGLFGLNYVGVQIGLAVVAVTATFFAQAYWVFRS